MKADFVFLCTEKWENMQPTEKGAFCSVCNKEVIDFSAKDINGVKSSLREEKAVGELCGRFKPAQLLELNFTSFFKKYTLWNLRKRLAVIFFFVLGSTLFSCSSYMGAKEPEHLAGTVAYEDPETIRKNDSIMKTQLENSQRNHEKKGN